MSPGVDEPGTVNWDLALCLLLAWILVYLCVCKGVKSSGKVSKMDTWEGWGVEVFVIGVDYCVPLCL